MKFWTIVLSIVFITSVCQPVLSQNVDHSDSDDSVVNENNSTDLEIDDSATNSTNDSDYEDIDGRDCDEAQPSFLDKWKVIYEQGKNVTVNKHVKHINETTQVLKKLKENLQFLLKPSENSQERFKAIEFFSEIDLGLTSECLTAFTRTLMAMGNGEIWALKFLDSMGRPLSSGFAEGTQSNFGEYSECLDITSPKSTNRAPIHGKYCLMKVIIPFPPIESFNENEPVDDQNVFSGLFDHYGLVKLSTLRAFIEILNLSNGTFYRMGVCIPAQCSAQEFEHLLNALLFPITRIPLEVGPQCHVKDGRKSLNNFQILSITFLSLSTLLIILSTGVEIYLREVQTKSDEKVVEQTDRTSLTSELLTSFSIIRNTRILFEKNTKYAALDTFRLLFIINVHLGHFFMFRTFFGLIGLKKIFSEVMPRVYEDNKYVFARNPIIIDSLFVLSGFLLSFGILRKLDKSKGRFNYIDFIFQRWIRFFTLMFGAILFFFLFPLTGDGPIWDIGVGWVTPGCQNPKTLLKMLFFVHNFRDDIKEQMDITNSECNPPTWFLSSLLQLTLIGPIFIIIYHNKRLFGLIALITALLISLLASIGPQLLFNIKPYLQIWELESVQFIVSRSIIWYHFMPNNYCTGYFTGIGFGYLLQSNIEISRRKSTIFWISSIVSCTAVYFWHNSFWRLDQSSSLLNTLLWHSIGKFVFCLGFGWIYFACCTKRGGILNDILCWHGFQPIARLSFGVYILHYLVVMHRIFSSHYTYVMSDKYMFEHLIIDLIYDIILAYIFYVTIESPFFNVFNHFMGPKVKPNVKNNKQSDLTDQLNNNHSHKNGQISDKEIYIINSYSEHSLNFIENNTTKL